MAKIAFDIDTDKTDIRDLVSKVDALLDNIINQADIRPAQINTQAKQLIVINKILRELRTLARIQKRVVHGPVKRWARR